MHVLIRVFTNGILVQVGNGPIHTCYDWAMAWDFVRPEDTVSVQDWSCARMRATP